MASREITGFKLRLSMAIMNNQEITTIKGITVTDITLNRKKDIMSIKIKKKSWIPQTSSMLQPILNFKRSQIRNH
jgi:hypothetical protein